MTQPTSDEGAVPTTEGTKPRSPAGDDRRGVSAFLFADIRGYTDFTAMQGADAAAALTGRFIDLATEAVRDHGGRVGGTWGDEVMAEFGSARQAVRAATALQARCVAATVEDGGAPLLVGIGLDAGEGADRELGTEPDGQSSGPTMALNRAARLCSRARPGEVLATRELVHLAGAVPGIVFVERGRAKLKGVPGRTTLVRVRVADQDTAQAQRFSGVVAQMPAARRKRRRRRAAVATLVIAVLLAGAGTWSVAHFQNRGDPRIPGDAVGVIDSGSGTLEATVTLPSGHHADAVGVGERAVWLIDSRAGRVSWVDRETHQILQTTPVGTTPVAAVEYDGSLWVVNQGSASVTQISERDFQEVGEPIPVGNQPTAIAAGFGYLWVANRADNQVMRVDPHRLQAVMTIDVGDGPAGVAVDDHAVWVTNRVDGTVSSIDPDTLAVGELIHVGAGPRSVLFAQGAVFVANQLDLTVSRIDPATARESGRFQVGDTPSGLTATTSAVWVSNAGSGTLTRFDVGEGRATRQWALGSSPVAVAGDGDRLWVATESTPSAAHRGGTLTIAYSDDWFEWMDPAREYLPTGWGALQLVYDGLVGLRRASGTTGLELVPDLAIALPRPSPDGLTYRFILRPGIVYSDGRPVRPEDVRRGLEREFIATADPDLPPAGAPFYYAGIVGGAECLDRPASCSLAKGIETGDGNTVTFHLTAPDPDFVYKLALPFASVVPPGTPMRGSHYQPYPGTGPYQVSELSNPDGPGASDATHGKITRQRLTLVRNLRFRQWSSVAQPAGFPDVIRWVPVTAADADKAIDTGDADVVWLDSRPDELRSALSRRMSLQYQDRYHETITGYTFSVFLNASVQPFSSLKARLAFIRALDAEQLAHGIDARFITCQLVPPDYPGYRPGCPYTTARDPTEWGRPDVTAGRKLAVQSGTTGQDVSVVLITWFSGADKELSAALKALGYHPRVVQLGVAEYFATIGAPRPQFDVTVMGWVPDYPATSQYFPLLACHHEENYSHVCDTRADALATQARSAQAVDPARAQRLWEDAYAWGAQPAGVIPFARDSASFVVSERTSPSFHVSWYGPLYSQMWVK